MSQQTMSPPPSVVNGMFEPCQECGAPMDRQQRYCVNCAARRVDADNPSSRYFAAANRWRRGSARNGVIPPKRGSRAAAVAFFALLPVAVAIGVLVGQGGGSDSGPSDEDLAALLANQGGVAAATTGATGTTTDDAKSETVSDVVLKSDFALEKGYTVKLELLPVSSTDQAAADAATAAAGKKGAKDVGIINPSDFQLTPDQGTEDYVLYSGEFKSKGDATKALGGLKKDYPKAEVIQVEKPETDSVGKVLAKTDKGVVHDVENYEPTEEQVQKDTAKVEELATATGDDYLDAQSEIPDVITIGGDGGGGDVPAGAGD